MSALANRWSVLVLYGPCSVSMWVLRPCMCVHVHTEPSLCSFSLPRGLAAVAGPQLSLFQLSSEL